ncbi:MAG: cytochrome c3 family protein [Planctomycetota bacterium]
MRIDQALVVIAVVVAALVLSCAPTADSGQMNIAVTPAAGEETPNTGGPPPLVVDTSAPLLLEEPTEESQRAGTAPATEAAGENAACFVCHANYRTEFLVSRHAQADIGCVNCHGESSAHRNDENNTTPPEIIYAADRIEPFCRKCHQGHDVPPGKVVARWIERNLDKTDVRQIVCTDCHGDHRMKIRTVIWDKRTGELLRTNRGN